MSAPIVSLGRDLTGPVGFMFDPADPRVVHPLDIQTIMWAIGGGAPPPGQEDNPQGAVRSAAYYLGLTNVVPTIDEVGVGTFRQLNPDAGSRTIGTSGLPWQQAWINDLRGSGANLTGVTHSADLAAYQPLITPGAAIPDATDAGDVVDTANAILAQLRAQALTTP